MASPGGGRGVAAAVLALSALAAGSLARPASPPQAPVALAFVGMRSLPHRRAPALAAPAAPRRHQPAGVSMRVKLQKDRQATFGFQRWWDPEWRSMQTANVKDPERQFDAQTLEMAKLMGVTPEELAKTMSNTAKAELDTSEYDNLLAACIKAAKAGDLGGMVQAREVLEKMDQVGIKPNVTAYNGVIAACARAAGGKFRPCTVNDTDTRTDLLERAAAMINYAGGRMDTAEFAKTWRDKYPNESLALWTQPAPNTTVPLSEILRASPRFTVQRGKQPNAPNTILVKRADKKAARKAGATTAGASTNSWVAQGLEFLDAMRKNNVKPDAQTYTALIGMCARAAADEAAFNAAAGAESNTMVDKAWELLAEMRAKGLPVELATYNALLNVCAAGGNRARADEVLEMLQAGSMQADAYTFTARMRLCPSAPAAEGVLSEMRDAGIPRNVAVYNTLLSIAQRDAMSEGVGGGGGGHRQRRHSA